MDETQAEFEARYLRECQAFLDRRDLPRLQLSLDVAAGVAILAQLKRTLRDPENRGPTAGAARRFTRALIEAVVAAAAAGDAGGAPTIRRGLELDFHD